MPRITILQDLSPQTKRREAAYVEGAEPGKIFNVATQELMDELQVIPCAYIRHHIEWKPNRGGFVRDHGDNAAIMASVVGQNDAKCDLLPNGNVIVPTGTWYCIDLSTGKQVIIPMARTQLKPSRKWMSMATSEVVEDKANGRSFPAPLFFRSYLLTARETSNDQNSWFIWNAERKQSILELIQERPELLQLCQQFSKLVTSGEVRASASDFEDEGMGGGGQQQGAEGTY